MNGAHLASPIRGELGYAHWPQLGSQIYCIIGNQIWGPIGKQDLCPNFALTAAKFVFSNSGNFRAKANPPKPRSCPKRSGVAMAGSAGSRNLGPRPLGAPTDRESRETSCEHIARILEFATAKARKRVF